MKGLLLQLRKPELQDVSVLVAWFEDPVFREQVFDLQGEDAQAKACFLLNANAKDSTRTLTLLACNEKNEPVGLILYQNVNWKHRNVEMNNAIGYAQHRYGVYGADLYLLGLTYAFLVLNMRKVFGYTYAGNQAAWKLNQYAAKLSGVLPNHLYKGNRYVDVAVFSILKCDFKLFLQTQADGITKRFIRSGMFADLLA